MTHGPGVGPNVDRLDAHRSRDVNGLRKMSSGNVRRALIEHDQEKRDREDPAIAERWTTGLEKLRKRERHD